jgi:hypothetical protein
MQILAVQNVSGLGMRRLTTEMKSEGAVKGSSLLERFLMVLMRALAVVAA